MSLNKRTYAPGTKIISTNLNEIQDEIITNASSITGKANISDIPTKVSDLTNDSNFQTSTQVNTAITTAISGITQFDYEIVASLPATGVKGKIYLVANSGSGQNIYDEYIWLTDKFEKLGTTEMDLTNYYTKSQTDSAISSAISGQTTVELEVTDENGNTGTLTVKGTLVWD